DRGLATDISRRRRRWLLGFAGISYAVMSSRLVWAFNGNFQSFSGWLGSNAYVWLSLALLVAMPITTAVAPAARPAGNLPVGDVPDLVDFDGPMSRRERLRSPASAGSALVGAEHP